MIMGEHFEDNVLSMNAAVYYYIIYFEKKEKKILNNKTNEIVQLTFNIKK